ncbi:hypothetical protein U8607_02500 [Methylobacterium durans]|uniref:hypothetical protein n=1 Tax=Methylobacterium durans TaxID=2202825 RepID=UPI002AFED3AB|nr:hypothetical protein [Methylobacterium durans]MEA1830941.1 hypothetical protein [Methylobacterium durans]
MSAPTIRALAGRLLRAEIAARRARDVEAVEKAVAPLIRIDEAGSFYAVDPSGKPLAGQGLDHVLGRMQSERPDMFEAAPPAKGSAIASDNPFARGPNFNITAQMVMWRADPERAEFLAAEAGFVMGRN